MLIRCTAGNLIVGMTLNVRIRDGNAGSFPERVCLNLLRNANIKDKYKVGNCEIVYLRSGIRIKKGSLLVTSVVNQNKGTNNIKLVVNAFIYGMIRMLRGDSFTYVQERLVVPH
jgi:hypothetical protein